MYSCAHNLIGIFALEIQETKENRNIRMSAKIKSSKLAPAVTKKRSSQSLKPNDKHNIYKFHFVLLHLKKMYSLFSRVGFLFFCPRSSLQSSVRNGSLAPECRCPKQTGYRTSQRGRMNPAHFAFVVYGV